MTSTKSIKAVVRLLAVGVAIVVTSGSASAQHGHADTGPTRKITGEVVDLVCFMQHPASGQGPEHAGCARQCIMKGLPAGLKAVDGTLYLLMASGHGSLRDPAAKLAGQVTTVEGHVIESGGMKALVVAHLAAGSSESGHAAGSHSGTDHSGHDH